MELIDVNNFNCEAECILKRKDIPFEIMEPYFGMLEAESAYVLMITSGHLEKQTHQTLICICPMLVFIEFIATAFHGEPPSPQYVVDHIDTNCRNNRPENLRWLTRLENALMNPITRKN